MKHFLIFFTGAFCVILLITQCNQKQSYNKFIDPELLKLAQFTDERAVDSIIPYLQHRQPLLRVEAAFALASVRDPKAVNTLHKSLLDAVAEVRAASAYALGQTLHPSSIEPLSIQLRYESNSAAIIAIAEAIGKIGGGLYASNSAPEFVENAANAIFNFERTDTIGIHAIAKAAFWLHNSGWDDSRFMNKLTANYASQPVINRRMIAFAAGRYRGVWFADTLQANAFIAALAAEYDTLARVGAMPVAGRTKSQVAKRFLTDVLQNPSSGMEQLIAAARAASKNESIDAQDLLPLLRNSNLSVAQEACLSLNNKRLTAGQLAELSALSSTLPASMQANIARLTHLQGDSLNLREWLTVIDSSLPLYDQLACIRALGITGKSATVCLQRALSTTNILQANAYTEAFIEAHSRADFPSTIPYADALISLIAKADIGITALCAAELRTIDSSLFNLKKLNSTLNEALEKLSLPKEIETANEIIKTLNTWGITPRDEIKAEYNNPIDWNLVKSIPRNQRAVIHTNKGDIEIELHVEDSPGSVASFVTLCRNGFYNGKTFHRVVPNFVIQGGCPRGDGMGGTDYTLRSEFRLHDYTSGSVGLASSGPDTESCQWFITHIPTPHLEGRYTIFAHVTRGLSIVDKIGIGDTIERIELLKD